MNQSHTTPLVYIDLKSNPLLSNIKKFTDRRNSNETICSKKTLFSSNVPTLETPTLRGLTLLEPNSAKCKVVQLESKGKLCSMLTILQRSYLMNNVIQGKNHKFFHILTQPFQDCSLCTQSNPHNLIMQKNLRRRYVTTRIQYETKVINDAITNERTNFVAIFRDFLIYDETDEYLKHFYNNKESTSKIPKAFNCFYKDFRLFPNYEAISSEKRLMRKYVNDKRYLRLLEMDREPKRAMRIFDTLFMNSMRFAETQSNSKKESMRLSKLLDTFLSKDSQVEIEKSKYKEVPKAELRLERNLAIKLGFATDRDDVCIIPIEEIRKVKINSGAASPRNEILLKTKSKYSATLHIQPHRKRNISTNIKKKPVKKVISIKIVPKTRNISRKRPSEILTAGRNVQKIRSSKTQKPQALVKMRVNVNNKPKKSNKPERNAKPKSQSNVLDVLYRKVKKDFINVLQKKSEVVNIKVKESPNKKKSLLSCRSVSNLNKRKDNTKTLVNNKKHNFD